AEVERVLDQLGAHGSVTRTDTPGGPLFHLDPSQALQAAFYRNTVVHFFVPGAIAELAVSMTASDPPTDRVAAFWRRVDELRDLLKFEFFFPEREAFRHQISAEMTSMDPAWEVRVTDDPEVLLSRAPLL